MKIIENYIKSKICFKGLHPSAEYESTVSHYKFAVLDWPKQQGIPAVVGVSSIIARNFINTLSAFVLPYSMVSILVI